MVEFKSQSENQVVVRSKYSWTTRKLTLKTLIDQRACQDQVELFRKRFGKSVNITPELCREVASLFNWDWAAAHLLGATAQTEYKRVRVAAQTESERVCALA
ncbi:MAG: hypothetical protein ACREQ5_07415, partial [Candidatus Dormibacteria bacterium]